MQTTGRIVAWQFEEHQVNIKVNEESEFGKSCHTRSTEPYFYEAAYQPVVARDTLFPSMGGESVLWPKIPL